MSRKPRLARLPDGTMFHCVNKLEMLFVYREIFDTGVYENPLIRIKDEDVILDVGANIGLFLLHMTRRCARSRIFAFEPIPRIFRALNENARMIQGHDVKAFSCGLSDRSGEAAFTFLHNVTARSTMYPEYSPADVSPQGKAREAALMLQIFEELPNGLLRWTLGAMPYFARHGLARAMVKLHARQRKIICPLKTVSQVIDENQLAHVDLLKIDVEGAERDVLRGIRDEHWPLIRQFILETHPGEGDVLGDVRKTLENRGYSTAVNDLAMESASIVFAARPV
jgi:31-O-methyltransferase